MTPHESATQKRDPRHARPAKLKAPELYHVIIHCRNETQQRELFERLRREGVRCRLTVL
jgi:hypothetical protein